jgi:hypothetical protein
MTHKLVHQVYLDEGETSIVASLYYQQLVPFFQIQLSPNDYGDSNLAFVAHCGQAIHHNVFHTLSFLHYRQHLSFHYKWICQIFLTFLTLSSGQRVQKILSKSTNRYFKPTFAPQITIKYCHGCFCLLG